MYCTLNTPKIDMDQVLCGQICLNDIVFVHRKGRRKDVEIKKTEQFLGLTIADNGYGCSYIKNIHQNSVVSKIPFIQVSFSILNFFSFLLFHSFIIIHIEICGVFPSSSSTQLTKLDHPKKEEESVCFFLLSCLIYFSFVIQ